MVKERFVDYLQYEKRFSPHTVTAYSNDLTQFYDFLKTDYEFQLGWHSFFVLDYWNPWVERSDPHTDSIGAGLHVFWLPNLDIQTFYKKEKSSAELNEYQDVLWFIVHSSI